MRKTLLYKVSMLMLLLAVAFILWALYNPSLVGAGVGTMTLRAGYWWIGYTAYILIMAGLFGSSFFIGDPK